MQIVHKDDIGLLVTDVDNDGIDFLEGVAYFSDEDGREYQVLIQNIVRIVEG